jgi:hypothetical protein
VRLEALVAPLQRAGARLGRDIHPMLYGEAELRPPRWATTSSAPSLRRRNLRRRRRDNGRHCRGRGGRGTPAARRTRGAEAASRARGCGRVRRRVSPDGRFLLAYGVALAPFTRAIARPDGGRGTGLRRPSRCSSSPWGRGV